MNEYVALDLSQSRYKAQLQSPLLFGLKGLAQGLDELKDSSIEIFKEVDHCI